MPEQVFFFITQQCNIRCITCYALESLGKMNDLDYNSKINIIHHYKKLGATKLTLLGGEPTLDPDLPDIIVEAKKIGFEFVRINTNGLFNTNLLSNEKFKNIDLICFSIDGSNDYVNNRIRKHGSLKNTLSNIRQAKKYGYEVRVNVTVTSLNVDNVFDLITLAEEEGASLIYFNIVMLMGEALKNEELEVRPKKWLEVYNRVLSNHNNYSIKIKIPPCFSATDELKYHKSHGHKCIIPEKSRVYVTSNGDVFGSIVHMDNTNYRIGYFKNDKYFKCREINVNNSLYCKYITCNSNGYYPLCIHYKTKLNY
jgi:MoaA/NifB/PqqE/SkfB family radical SAM enzyme